MSGLDRTAAFKAERAEVLAFCQALSPADWRMNSLAEGWSIQDVVAHMGGGAHAMFGPAGAKLMRGKDIERLNDDMVAFRRTWTPERVLGEYRRWTGVFASVMGRVGGSPAGRLRLPLAELGKFPLRHFLSALTFDTYTHLHHDMAPALGATLPPPDANRLSVTLEWMTAVLSNQLRLDGSAFLDRPAHLTLTGPGGGAWLLGVDGSVAPGSPDAAAVRIRGVAVEFPEWGTKRAHWADRDVTIDGDVDYGARFLDWMNIV